MKTTLLLLMLMLAFGSIAIAQENGTAKPRESPGTADPALPKTSKPGPDATVDEKFSAAVAEALMSRMAQGLIRKNAKVFLSSVEPARFPGYATFAERVTALLDRSDSFRPYYRVLDAAAQNGKGAATVEFQMERASQSRGAVPERKRAQLRLECERGAKGWRIVRLAPADFFTQP